MKLSKKCHYALKAVVELAARNSGRPVKIQQIADAQAVPHRFLEVILNELRHGGLVESRRGNDGGYMLARASTEVTVGDVIEQVEGVISINPNGAGDDVDGHGTFGDLAFEGLWRDVDSAIWAAFRCRSIADLVKAERAARAGSVPNYCI